MLLIHDEKRRNRRTRLSLTARIEGYADKFMRWDESTTLNDVSEFGAGFTLSRPVKPGRLLKITAPLPRELRSYDFRSVDYSTWAVVRRCIKSNPLNSADRYSVGVAFTGKDAPLGFEKHPLAKYELAFPEPIEGAWQLAEHAVQETEPPAAPKERRQSRLQIPEEVTLELVDENGWAFASEETVTINLSRGGAAVYTQLDANVGSFVRFSSRRNDVRIISVVRGKHAGQAGLSRMNLEFIDQAFPIDIVS